MRLLRPAVIAPIFCLIYLIVIAVQSQSPLVWVTLSTINVPADLQAYGYTEEGYDGQFNYLIARDPVEAQAYVDVPAYRYQRILLPALVRFLAFGQNGALPYLFIGINLLMLGVVTWAL